MRRDVRRSVLVSVVVAASLVGASGAHAATSAATGLPLYQFVNSGTGPLPWNAASLVSSLNGTKMLGGPHSTANATEGVLAYRSTSSDVDLYVQPDSGSPAWSDLSALASLPTPAADPVPFFDPSGSVDVIYVNSIGQLVILCANDPLSHYWPHARQLDAWRPEVAVNLSALSGVSFANGLASVQVERPRRDGGGAHRGQHHRGLRSRLGPGWHRPVPQRAGAQRLEPDQRGHRDE